MMAWHACSGTELLARSPDAIAGALAARQMARRLAAEPARLTAWRRAAAILRDVVRLCGGADWTIAFEFDLLRLEKRIDAVLLTDRAIVVLEFKNGAHRIENADRAQAEDPAQDLRNFHADSRMHPIVPVVVATECPAPAPFQPPLPISGAHPAAEASAATLAALLTALHRALPPPMVPLDGTA
jgi:hypothetical protein